jgi:hypothetical protein
MKTLLSTFVSRAALCLTAVAMAALFLTVCASPSLATPLPISIDNFAVPDPAQYFMSNDSGTPPTPVATYLLKTAAAGDLGERDMLVQAYGPPSGPDVNPFSFVGWVGRTSVNSGVLFTGGPAGTALTLQYDGTDSGDTASGLVDAKGAGLVDLTAGGGNDRFVLDFGYLNTDDANPMRLQVKVESDKGTALFQGTVAENGNRFIEGVNFADFAGYNPNPANNPFTSVQSVTFELNYAVGGKADANVDYELRSIQAVPEPSTIAMGGIGCMLLVGQVVLRKWRKGGAAK